MVYYFTSSEGYTIYMGKDKFENEDLIKHGFLEDIWFHVDNLSSAHVYVRLPNGRLKLDDLTPKCLEECCQLVKENSIEGSKKKTVAVVYTKWKNLHKTAGMEVGQDREVLRALNKTKVEKFPDLQAMRIEQEAFYKSERKKSRLRLESEMKAQKEERSIQKELRSYESLTNQKNNNTAVKSSADLSSAVAFEEDFM